jgi:hypothetical protein
MKSIQSTRRLFVRSVISAVALGSSIVGMVSAQEGDRHGNHREINIPCCQCGDGGSKVVDLSTGVAPWTSPNGAVNPIAVVNGWKIPTPPAKWVNTGSDAPGVYTYTLHINVPKNCSNTPRVSFSGTAWGDNNITVRLDDKTLGTTPVSSGGQANYGFRDPYGVNVSGGIGPGSHTLSVAVRNDDGPTGFLLDGKLKIECHATGLYTQGDRPVY